MMCPRWSLFLCGCIIIWPCSVCKPGHWSWTLSSEKVPWATPPNSSQDGHCGMIMDKHELIDLCTSSGQRSQKSLPDNFTVWVGARVSETLVWTTDSGKRKFKAVKECKTRSSLTDPGCVAMEVTRSRAPPVFFFKSMPCSSKLHYLCRHSKPKDPHGYQQQIETAIAVSISGLVCLVIFAVVACILYILKRQGKLQTRHKPAFNSTGDWDQAEDSVAGNNRSLAARLNRDITLAELQATLATSKQTRGQSLRPSRLQPTVRDYADPKPLRGCGQDASEVNALGASEDLTPGMRRANLRLSQHDYEEVDDLTVQGAWKKPPANAQADVQTNTRADERGPDQTALRKQADPRPPRNDYDHINEQTMLDAPITSSEDTIPGTQSESQLHGRGRPQMALKKQADLRLVREDYEDVNDSTLQEAPPTDSKREIPGAETEMHSPGKGYQEKTTAENCSDPNQPQEIEGDESHSMTEGKQTSAEDDAADVLSLRPTADKPGVAEDIRNICSSESSEDYKPVPDGLESNKDSRPVPDDYEDVDDWPTLTDATANDAITLGADEQTDTCAPKGIPAEADDAEIHTQPKQPRDPIRGNDLHSAGGDDISLPPRPPPHGSDGESEIAKDVGDLPSTDEGEDSAEDSQNEVIVISLKKRREI